MKIPIIILTIIILLWYRMQLLQYIYEASYGVQSNDKPENHPTVTCIVSCLNSKPDIVKPENDNQQQENYPLFYKILLFTSGLAIGFGLSTALEKMQINNQKLENELQQMEQQQNVVTRQRVEPEIEQTLQKHQQNYSYKIISNRLFVSNIEKKKYRLK